MRYRITILLLIISASLTALIFKLDKSTETTASASGKADIFGPEIQLADYLQVRSEQLGEYNPRTLEKPNNQPWQIVEPVRWTANPYHLNQILNQIQFLPKNYSFTVSSILNAGQTLETYGLQNPRLQLTLGWGDQKQTIEFGSPTEMGGKTYLLGPDRAHIYAISQQLEKVLLQSPVYWRSQEVLTLPIIDVNTISLQINNSGNLTKIRLEKTDNEWELQAPIKTKANTPLVNNSLNHLQNVKVLQFLDAKTSAEAQAALLKPDIRITLHGTRETQTLHLAEPLESGKLFLYAKLEAYPNTPFTVSSTPFRNLRNAQTYFRQKHFLTFKPSSIHNVTLTTSEAKTSLQKLEGGDWQVQAPGEEPRWTAAENSKVERLLTTLLNLHAIHFPNDAPSQEDLQRMGLETPLETITLSSAKENANRIILQMGRSESNETLYVKLADSPYIYEVSNTITQQLPAHPIHYRLRRLQPNNQIPANATLQSITLMTLPDRKTVFEYPDKEKDPPTPPDVLKLTEHLKTLSAKDYMQTPFEEKFFQNNSGQIAWRYLLNTTWQLPSANEPANISLNLYLTQRENGTDQGAGHPDSKLSFTLEQTTVDLLHKVLPHNPTPPEYIPPTQEPEPKAN
jgi:hypothetical protein